MGSTIKLDVRGLPPPEPFVNVMQALQTLPAGAALHVQIYREPYPLYDALREAGYTWRTSALADGDFQIEIVRAP